MVIRGHEFTEGFKIKELELFDRDSRKLNTFITHLKVYFKLNLAKFVNNYKKVLYIAICL
jgi:lipopolysaccharide biosynthesis glycosyltransferase